MKFFNSNTLKQKKERKERNNAMQFIQQQGLI